MSQMTPSTMLGTTRPPTKSWFSRHKTLTIVLALSSLLVMACLFIGGVLAVATLALRSSDAYRLALTRAEHDPLVIAALGAPIHPGWLVTGEIKASRSDGEARLAIPVSGPRGSGKLYVQASKSGGTWAFSQLSVDAPGRSAPLDLLATP